MRTCPASCPYTDDGQCAWSIASGKETVTSDDAPQDAQQQREPLDEPIRELENESAWGTIKRIFMGLEMGDKLMTPLIFIAMVIGIVVGLFAPNAQENLSKGDWKGVSVPLVVGLLVMMWPILAKVQYERMPQIIRTRQFVVQILISLGINWIIAPFISLGLGWATLPDLESYRTGFILVGIARCIAMVMIWVSIAKGDINYCAMLVIINSLLQIVLYAPMALFFINVISGTEDFALDYSDTAQSVAIYLGIPLAAGLVTRFGGIYTMGKDFYENKFMPWFGQLSFLGLLFTIIVIFAEQARHILDNLGPTFRCFVPYVLYFSIAWTITFVALQRMSRKYGGTNFGYKMTVVQSFTAASNNFELAIAVAISVYGSDSDQALAASIGPLVEVPVLVILSWVALFLGERLGWDKNGLRQDPEAANVTRGVPQSQPEPKEEAAAN